MESLGYMGHCVIVRLCSIKSSPVKPLNKTLINPLEIRSCRQQSINLDLKLRHA